MILNVIKILALETAISQQITKCLSVLNGCKSLVLEYLKPYNGLVWYGLVGRVFANGLGDLGSIPGRVIPKTLKMVLDTSLLNT